MTGLESSQLDMQRRPAWIYPDGAKAGKRSWFSERRSSRRDPAIRCRYSLPSTCPILCIASRSELLAKVRQLQTLIDKVDYTPSVRNDVFAISADLLQYVDFRVDLGSFGSWKKEKCASRLG